VLNIAYTGQVGQCIHSMKIGPGHILYQHGRTSDLQAILQQRDKSRTTSIEMMNPMKQQIQNIGKLCTELL